MYDVLLSGAKTWELRKPNQPLVTPGSTTTRLFTSLAPGEYFLYCETAGGTVRHLLCCVSGAHVSYSSHGDAVYDLGISLLPAALVNKHVRDGFKCTLPPYSVNWGQAFYEWAFLSRRHCSSSVVATPVTVIEAVILPTVGKRVRPHTPTSPPPDPLALPSPPGLPPQESSDAQPPLDSAGSPPSSPTRPPTPSSPSEPLRPPPSPSPGSPPPSSHHSSPSPSRHSSPPAPVDAPPQPPPLLPSPAPQSPMELGAAVGEAAARALSPAAPEPPHSPPAAPDLQPTRPDLQHTRPDLQPPPLVDDPPPPPPPPPTLPPAASAPQICCPTTDQPVLASDRRELFGPATHISNFTSCAQHVRGFKLTLDPQAAINNGVAYCPHCGMCCSTVGRTPPLLQHMTNNPVCSQHILDPADFITQQQLAASVDSPAYWFNSRHSSFLPASHRGLIASDDETSAADAADVTCVISNPDDYDFSWLNSISATHLLCRDSATLRTPPSALYAEYYQALRLGYDMLAARQGSADEQLGMAYVTCARFAILARFPGSPKLSKDDLRRRIRRILRGELEAVFTEADAAFAQYECTLMTRAAFSYASADYDPSQPLAKPFLATASVAECKRVSAEMQAHYKAGHLNKAYTLTGPPGLADPTSPDSEECIAAMYPPTPPPDESAWQPEPGVSTIRASEEIIDDVVPHAPRLRGGGLGGAYYEELAGVYKYGGRRSIITIVQGLSTGIMHTGSWMWHGISRLSTLIKPRDGATSPVSRLRPLACGGPLLRVTATCCMRQTNKTASTHFTTSTLASPLVAPPAGRLAQQLRLNAGAFDDPATAFSIACRASPSVCTTAESEAYSILRGVPSEYPRDVLDDALSSARLAIACTSADPRSHNFGLASTAAVLGSIQASCVAASLDDDLPDLADEHQRAAAVACVAAAAASAATACAASGTAIEGVPDPPSAAVAAATAAVTHLRQPSTIAFHALTAATHAAESATVPVTSFVQHCAAAAAAAVACVVPLLAASAAASAAAAVTAACPTADVVCPTSDVVCPTSIPRAILNASSASAYMGAR